MLDINDKLIVALDVDSLKKAEYFVDILYPRVKIFKVGSQLFTVSGPEAVKMVAKKGAHVFLDLKFHDIPNTVFLSIGTGTALNYEIHPNITGTVIEATELAVFMMTVHIQGGIAMLKSAVRGATEKANALNIARPFIVGVTRLTSEEYNENTQAEVLSSARLAKDAGLDGIVCAASEAGIVRKEFGGDFIIVTPGIRPKGVSAGDQKRIATAQEAIKAGADYIVVGRPIIESENPLSAAEKILDDIKEAVSLK